MSSGMSKDASARVVAAEGGLGAGHFERLLAPSHKRQAQVALAVDLPFLRTWQAYP